MNTALPTASSAYGPDRPSAAATVDNATLQEYTYRRQNPVQTNGASSMSKATEATNTKLRTGTEPVEALDKVLRPLLVIPAFIVSKCFFYA